MQEKEKKRTRRKAPPEGVAAQAAPATAQRPAGPREARPPAALAPARPAARTESISSEERRHMIAEAAYFRAQHRGFRGGDPDRDWIEAEVEIDALLLDRR